MIRTENNKIVYCVRTFFSFGDDVVYSYCYVKVAYHTALREFAEGGISYFESGVFMLSLKTVALVLIVAFLAAESCRALTVWIYAKFFSAVFALAHDWFDGIVFGGIGFVLISCISAGSAAIIFFNNLGRPAKKFLFATATRYRYHLGILRFLPVREVAQPRTVLLVFFVLTALSLLEFLVAI